MNKVIRQQFQKSRKGREDLVVVEGFHGIKHALRFGAQFSELFVTQRFMGQAFPATADDLATRNTLKKVASIISEQELKEIAPKSCHTAVCGLAHKNQDDFADIDARSGHTVVLENPMTHDNLGAVIRVCAARGVAGLVVTGDTSPWHANTVRAAAGLQWSLPIVQTTLAEMKSRYAERTIYACTDEGVSMYDINLFSDGVLVFGTEREGITKELRSYADMRVGIPMVSGVSSMNLATSVSAVLFKDSCESL